MVFDARQLKPNFFFSFSFIYSMIHTYSILFHSLAVPLLILFCYSWHKRCRIFFIFIFFFHFQWEFFNGILNYILFIHAQGFNNFFLCLFIFCHIFGRFHLCGLLLVVKSLTGRLLKGLKSVLPFWCCLESQKFSVT